MVLCWLQMRKLTACRGEHRGQNWDRNPQPSDTKSLVLLPLDLFFIWDTMENYQDTYFLKRFYIFERENAWEHKQGWGEGQGERKTPHWAGQRQPLSWLSHPGAPTIKIFRIRKCSEEGHAIRRSWIWLQNHRKADGLGQFRQFRRYEEIGT